MENNFFELSDEQKAELDAMREAKAQGETTFITWDEMKEKLQARLKHRIDREKKGESEYEDARSAVADIKNKMKDIKHKKF